MCAVAAVTKPLALAAWKVAELSSCVNAPDATVDAHLLLMGMQSALPNNYPLHCSLQDAKEATTCYT
jgi:hypothetical protein